MRTEIERMKTLGRPLGEHEAKRKEIAQAAWAVISERGIEGASMRAIAREAGYTTGAIVHYFENKDQLLEYVLTQESNRVDRKLEEALNSEDILGRLRDIACSNLPLNRGDARKMSVWQSYLDTADNNPQIAETIREIVSENVQHLTKLVLRGQELGLIRTDFEASELADQLYAVNEGFVRIAPFEPERLNAERLTKLVDVQIELIKP